MSTFAIDKKIINGEVICRKILPGGREMEAIGAHGYDEICRRLTAEESAAEALRFLEMINQQVEEGKAVRLKIEENEATKKMKCVSAWNIAPSGGVTGVQL